MEKDIFSNRGMIYYRTKEAVEKVKRKNDRVYYVAGLGYYIVRPSKRGWW